MNVELNDKELEVLNAALYPDAPSGSTSNGLTLSADQRTLYIANADNNCLAVFDVAEPGKSRSKGFIPTGWYPTNVKVLGKIDLSALEKPKSKGKKKPEAPAAKPAVEEIKPSSSHNPNPSPISTPSSLITHNHTPSSSTPSTHLSHNSMHSTSTDSISAIAHSPNPPEYSSESRLS